MFYRGTATKIFGRLKIPHGKPRGIFKIKEEFRYSRSLTPPPASRGEYARYVFQDGMALESISMPRFFWDQGFPPCQVRWSLMDRHDQHNASLSPMPVLEKKIRPPKSPLPSRHPLGRNFRPFYCFILRAYYALELRKIAPFRPRLWKTLLNPLKIRGRGDQQGDYHCNYMILKGNVIRLNFMQNRGSPRNSKGVRCISTRFSTAFPQLLWITGNGRISLEKNQ